MIGMFGGTLILLFGVAVSTVDFLPGLIMGIAGGVLVGMSLADWEVSP